MVGMTSGTAIPAAFSTGSALATAVSAKHLLMVNTFTGVQGLTIVVWMEIDDVFRVHSRNTGCSRSLNEGSDTGICSVSVQLLPFLSGNILNS
jgi:hypothetical protein